MIGINNLVISFTRAKQQKKWKAKCFFFTSEMQPVIETCIQKYDAHQGEEIREINADLLEEFFSDPKLRMGLHKLIIRLFQKGEKEKSTKLSIGEQEQEEGQSFNDVDEWMLTETLSGELIEIPHSPEEIREQLFVLAQKQSGGAVLSESERERIFQQIEEKVGYKIPRDYPWMDLAPFQLLKPRPATLTASKVIEEYNRGVFETILYYSEEVRIYIPQLTPQFVKEIIWLAKNHGIWVEIGKNNEWWELKLSGPYEVYGREHAYGNRLRRYLLALFRRKLLDPSATRVEIDARLRRPCMLEFEPRHWEEYRLIQFGEESEKVLEVDSFLEAELLQNWGMVRNGWKVRIAREAILLPSGKIYLPDVEFYTDKAKIYGEIVGFWTEEYLKKKREKLIELSQILETDFLVIVDRKLKEKLNLPQNLPHLREIVFDKHINCTLIEETLEKIARQNVKAEDLIKKLLQLLELNKDKKIIEGLQELTELELQVLRELQKDQQQFPSDIRILPAGWIVRKEWIDEVNRRLCEELSTRDQIPVKEVQPVGCPSKVFYKLLPQIIDTKYFRIKYKSLFEPTIEKKRTCEG